jgi:hypothetical protein
VGEWHEEQETNSLVFSDRGMMIQDNLLDRLIWAPILPVEPEGQQRAQNA